MVNQDLAYGRDERFDGVYVRQHGLATNYGGGDIGLPVSVRPVENSVPAGATDFTYTIIVGNRHPRDRDDAPAPNRTVIDLPAGVTAAGLAIEANTCRGVNHGKDEDGVYYEQFCTKRGADDDWSEPVEGWKLVISEIEGRQRLDIKNLPAVRWGQRVRYTILTSPVPATSAGADHLRLDVWVEPARNEPGWCDQPAGCDYNDRRANNFNGLTTRIVPPGKAADAAGTPAADDGRARLVPPVTPAPVDRALPAPASISGVERRIVARGTASVPDRGSPVQVVAGSTDRGPPAVVGAGGDGQALAGAGEHVTARPPPGHSQGGVGATEPLEPIPIRALP
ncbi:MAG: hypothetical protein IT340_04280 [Chloroflexi bacterium]|nr:hypothetical protein [Chloroflexota bacterium]